MLSVAFRLSEELQSQLHLPRRGRRVRDTRRARNPRAVRVNSASTVGVAKLARLNRLKISTRNCRFCLPICVFLKIDRSTVDTPQIFEFNALCIVSDGVSTRHGVWTATPEWYAPWKSIDGEHIEPSTTGSMRALVEGLFPKERLLSYMRDFIAFEVANEKITKKGAKYHQFFAVRKAAAKAVETHRAGTDRRLGVIWHTTGSGKSLSMGFLVGLLRRRPELENPSFVIQVDRTDLDDQLFDQFVAVRSLVGEVKHADSVEQLRDLLATSGGEVMDD